MEEDLIKIIKDTLSNMERIRNFKNHPGKFEAESLATNYYYDLSLDGGSQIFELTQTEKDLFQIEESFIAVMEDNNGFVSLIRSNNESYLESLFEEESEFEEQ